jgi:hypothetical protein
MICPRYRMKVIGCLSLDSPPRQRNENKAIYDEKLTDADPARNYCPGSGGVENRDLTANRPCAC